MKLIRYNIIIVCLALLSCNKDIIGYDALNTNMVSIELANISPEVFFNEKLNLKANLNLDQKGSYSFQWKAYNLDGFSKIISTEKDLEAIIDIPIGRYDLEYRVTDNMTGVHSFQLVQLEVKGRFSSGWIVTYNNKDKGEVAFIRSDDEVFYNLIQNENGKSINEKAVATFTGARQGLGLTYFFTEKNIYRMGAEDFFINGEIDAILEARPTNIKNVCYGLNGYATEQFLLLNGGIHIGIGPFFYSESVLSPFTDRLAGDYDLFPGIINSSMYFGYFYDNKHKRFLSLQLMSTDLVPVASTTKESDSYDLANVGKTLIAYDQGPSIDYYSKEIYLILSDNNDRFLYSIKSTSPGRAQKIEKSPLIDKAKFFATSRILPHLYYATENKIYLYDMEQNSSKLVYEFPGGTDIADVKMYRQEGTSLESKRLVVATNTDEIGEVYYFDIAPLGTFVNNNFFKKVGGFGTISSLNLK